MGTGAMNTVTARVAPSTRTRARIAGAVVERDRCAGACDEVMRRQCLSGGAREERARGRARVLAPTSDADDGAPADAARGGAPRAGKPAAGERTVRAPRRCGARTG